MGQLTAAKTLTCRSYEYQRWQSNTGTAIWVRFKFEQVYKGCRCASVTWQGFQKVSLTVVYWYSLYTFAANICPGPIHGKPEVNAQQIVAHKLHNVSFVVTMISIWKYLLITHMELDWKDPLVHMRKIFLTQHLGNHRGTQHRILDVDVVRLRLMLASLLSETLVSWIQIIMGIHQYGG
jgi:hypothetical protein